MDKREISESANNQHDLAQMNAEITARQTKIVQREARMEVFKKYIQIWGREIEVMEERCAEHAEFQKTLKKVIADQQARSKYSFLTSKIINDQLCALDKEIEEREKELKNEEGEYARERETDLKEFETQREGYLTRNVPEYGEYKAIKTSNVELEEETNKLAEQISALQIKSETRRKKLDEDIVEFVLNVKQNHELQQLEKEYEHIKAKDLKLQATFASLVQYQNHQQVEREHIAEASQDQEPKQSQELQIQYESDNFAESNLLDAACRPVAKPIFKVPAVPTAPVKLLGNILLASRPAPSSSPLGKKRKCADPKRVFEKEMHIKKIGSPAPSVGAASPSTTQQKVEFSHFFTNYGGKKQIEQVSTASFSNSKAKQMPIDDEDKNIMFMDVGQREPEISSEQQEFDIAEFGDITQPQMELNKMMWDIDGQSIQSFNSSNSSGMEKVNEKSDVGFNDNNSPGPNDADAFFSLPTNQFGFPF